MALSLYVHIPFCLKRCIYCDFVSGDYNPGKADAYIKAVKKEILTISRKTSRMKGSQTLKSLYIGGGTPTVLSANTLSSLINHIFSNLHFVRDYEATIEVNPGTVDSEKLQALCTSGINRISIGVQSFNDDELDCLGRLHSSDDAEQAVYLARDAGFDNIGVDLIYGIPGQNMRSWKNILKKAVSLKLQHISTYELTVEQGTLLNEYINNPPSPLFSKGGKGGFVEEEIIIEMYSYAIKHLKAEGFIQYEISNFAKPGYSCRHNLHYWNRGEYYGAGLGAHSFINGKRFYDTDNLRDYVKAISENKSSVQETEDITRAMAVSEAIFLGLRQTDGIKLKNFQALYGRDIATYYQKEIRELQEAGLLEVEGISQNTGKAGSNSLFGQQEENTIRLTEKGMILSNEVFMKFM